jgi:hypothetical protein
MNFVVDFFNKKYPLLNSRVFILKTTDVDATTQPHHPEAKEIHDLLFPFQVKSTGFCTKSVQKVPEQLLQHYLKRGICLQNQ